jgi:hypothetical protein
MLVKCEACNTYHETGEVPPPISVWQKGGLSVLEDSEYDPPHYILQTDDGEWLDDDRDKAQVIRYATRILELAGKLGKKGLGTLLCDIEDYFDEKDLSAIPLAKRVSRAIQLMKEAP